MFFEANHSLEEREFRVLKGEFINFPLHFHRSFEYFEQIEGSTEVLVGGQKYVLRAGEAVLIFPLQPHAYAALEKGSLRLLIFSPDLVADFYRKTEKRLPTDHKFRCVLPDPLIAENVFHQKALAYFICGEFEKGREYTAVSERLGDKLFLSLLLFADRNLSSRCLLRDASAEIGYDYAYISKFFKKRAGISFRQYVNNLRITESKNLLLLGTKSIEEIAEASGFSSLRAFDREFRAQTGMTPKEYRRSGESR